MAGDAVCCREVVHAVHGYPQQFTERKRSKKKEGRPTTAFFFSSNDNGNDHLKSGQPWSEELGAPQAGVVARRSRYLWLKIPRNYPFQKVFEEARWRLLGLSVELAPA
jgi:hypothetical protein